MKCAHDFVYFMYIRHRGQHAAATAKSNRKKEKKIANTNSIDEQIVLSWIDTVQHKPCNFLYWKWLANAFKSNWAKIRFDTPSKRRPHNSQILRHVFDFVSIFHITLFFVGIVGKQPDKRATFEFLVVAFATALCHLFCLLLVAAAATATAFCLVHLPLVSRQI